MIVNKNSGVNTPVKKLTFQKLNNFLFYLGKNMITTRRLAKIYQNLDYFAAASESQMRNSKNILEIHNENGVREGIKLAKTLLENAERQELA